MSRLRLNEAFLFHFTDWEPDRQKLTTGHQKWDENTDLPSLKQECSKHILYTSSCGFPQQTSHVWEIHKNLNITEVQKNFWPKFIPSSSYSSVQLHHHCFSISSPWSSWDKERSEHSRVITELFTETPLRAAHEQALPCTQPISQVLSDSQNTEHASK